MAHDIFLSYSHKDKAAADAVCHALEAARIRVWMAPRDVIPGAEWGESIIRAIGAARAVVLVFSGHSNGSRQVRLEIERAINRELPIIPFRIENVAPSAALELFISSSHWLDAYAPPFDPHLESLTQAVMRLLAKPAAHEAALIEGEHRRHDQAEAGVAHSALEERLRKAETARETAESSLREARFDAAIRAEDEEQRRKGVEAAQATGTEAAPRSLDGTPEEAAGDPRKARWEQPETQVPPPPARGFSIWPALLLIIAALGGLAYLLARYPSQSTKQVTIAPTAAPAPPAIPTPAAPSTSAPDKSLSTDAAAMQERQKQCGLEWNANKEEIRKTNSKMRWPQYWSECNKRLKSEGQ